MKKLLLILLCLPMIGFGQQTYVPDDGFEQWLINLGYDTVLDDSVATASIDTVTDLYVESPSQFLTIVDIIGIEDFAALETLEIAETFIFDLDVSSNINLTHLEIQTLNTVSLTSLNVSGATDLTHIIIDGGSLASLDLSNSTALTHLRVWFNSLTSLDVSNCPNLTYLDCRYNNQLTTLNISNGNNTNFDTTSFWTGFPTYEVYVGNSPAECIEVDDVAWATANLTAANYNIDPNDFFSTNCATAYGCTNTLACNYDALATIDDSSCTYLNTSVFISNVSCNGYSDGGIVATATGGATPNYQYSLGGGLSQNNGTFSNLTAGTYFIDVTDINGCSSNQTVIITEPNPLFVNAFSTDISCFGYCDGSAFCMPSGGTSPYSYLWSGGNTIVTDNISGLCAGAYVVNITDANNCINIETVLISEPLPLVSNNTINGCDSVLIGSNYYTISGAYTDTLTSVNGCDSVVNTNLTIEQNTSSYDTLSVGASIVWNGIPLNASGDYSVILINSVGCDSIVNLNLTVTTTGISDIVNNKSNLIKITDMLGQETPYRRNTPLFYIYDDGTVEKRIILE